MQIFNLLSLSCPTVRHRRGVCGRRLATLLCWLSGAGLASVVPAGSAESTLAPPQGDPSLEFIVQADLLDGRSRRQDPHCALAISANHINGQFVALVYKLSPAQDEHVVEGLYKISPGTVDWTNGIESFIEPDLAWVEAATHSTEMLGTVLSEPYARVHERRLRGESASALYDAMLEGPVTVYVESAGIESIYPMQVPFVPEVVLRARACAEDLLPASAR